MVCGTLDHCFIMTHSIHNWGDLLWCDILLKKEPRTGPHHICRIYTLCPFSGHKNTDGSGVGRMILLASVCYCDSWVRKHFFIPSPVSAIRTSLMASSSSLIFSPSHCNKHLQQSALFTFLCMTWHSCSNPMPLQYEHLPQWQQNRSKATMCLV